jgi:flagellar hook-associated protein 3 FlgL
MRVTQGMIYDATNRGLATTMAAVQSASEKVSSTKALNRPSDNPADVRSAIQLRDALSELNQFQRNIDGATTKVDAMDGALADAGDLIQRANELSIAGGDGTLSAANRQAMAQEVSQIIESLAQDAGAKVGDAYLFSGFQVNKPPYVVTGPGTVGAYQGDHGVALARIGPGATVQTSVAGDSAFQAAFDALTQLKGDLDAGTVVQAGTISKIQIALDGILTTRAQVGARADRLEQAKASQGSLVTSNQGLLSQLEDVDMASAITELSRRQTTYQATLAVTAKVMQTSLIDYLR